MSILEMFESFDIRSWANNGIVSRTPTKAGKVPTRTRRSGTWGRKFLVPAAAAASLAFFCHAELAAQSGITLRSVGANLGALLETLNQNAYEPWSAVNAFEQQSKALMVAVASGKLPAISHETLAAAREATQRHVSLSTDSDVPAWIIELSTKIGTLSD